MVDLASLLMKSMTNIDCRYVLKYQLKYKFSLTVRLLMGQPLSDLGRMVTHVMVGYWNRLATRWSQHQPDRVQKVLGQHSQRQV